MARQPNTELRRAEIVAAMLPVMARHGYERATIQAIAGEAGLAPGLIHYHFKNKQEILVSLVESIAEFAQARFAQVLGQASAPAERLEAYLQARLGLGEGAAPDMVSAWVMIGVEAVRQAEVRQVYQRLVGAELEALTDLVGACLAEQGREPSRALPIAAGLMALMEGAFLLSGAAEGLLPVGYAADAAIAFARQSVLVSPKGRRRSRMTP